MTNPPRKDSVFVIIESIHLPDHGTQENVHGLPPEKLKLREVVYVDVGREPLNNKDSKDPKKFVSQKTGRGPFTGNWSETAKPIMTCYKLVTIEIKVWAFQSRVENFVANYQKKIFSNFHQDLVCGMDDWLHLTMAEIRVFEERTKRELDEKKAAAANKRPGSGRRRSKTGQKKNSIH
ncbi:hypothetical protein GE061_005701 [Apolygus lucorum]|uniref:Phosphatidylinositol transfer protein N-terminal domain-containing protein n=1 Tax=Apolygus lucorum TaxID=248454 RepID=A0A8S9WYE1_APOLU|nr:hypothetical protein GE061_005701 [Apolygus lucorum]